MTFKRGVDPFLLSAFLDWVGKLLTLYWIGRQLRRFANSKSLLFFGMRLSFWIAHLRYDLPRGRLPSSLSFPLKAFGSPFISFMNWLYLRMAFKYDPSTW